MTHRNLRSVPAALLMTTALSWSLPALAQTSTAPGTAPNRAASATAPSTSTGLHPGARVTPPTGTGTMGSPATQTTPGTSAAPGTSTNGLPPNFEPAMPGAKSSAPAAGKSSGGAYQAPSTRP